MENRKFVISSKYIFLFLGIFIFNFLLIYFFVFAYSPYYTHPDLTEEIAKFFNLKTTDVDLKISQNEIQWMREGAINEDTPPRWINHFYDPIYKVGWQGKHFGDRTQEQGLYSGESMAPKPAIASIDWVTNQEYQSAYGRQHGNQTWQKAIKLYIDGDRKSAFIALGHILHLIEDASVPDHTRNDTHADLHGDPGSPYEEYSKKQTNFNKPNIAENLKNKTFQNFLTIQSAFEYLANYSNNNFFSEDTINNEEFNNPDIKTLQTKKEIVNNETKSYLYLNGVYLAKKDIDKFNIIYTVNDEFFVLPSYFSNLSEQAVLTGAGVLNLFFQEVEKYRNNPELLPKIIEDSNEAILSYLQKSPRLALVNISDIADKTTTNSQIYLAQAGDFFSGIFGTNDEASENQNFQPTGEIFSNQQAVQYEGFQTLENQVNQSNQIAEQLSAPANESQTAIIGQIENDIPAPAFNRQQLLAEIQANLDLIKTQAEEINQQEKQLQFAILTPIQTSYGGSGSGGGGGSSVIVTPGPIAVAAESQNLSTENNSTSTTTNSAIIIDDGNTTFTIDSTATSTADFTPIATSTDEIATTTPIAANHIVISEIQAGVDGNPDNEFVELYNPTEQAVDLTNWSLKRKTSPNATSTKNLVLRFSTSTIAAKSFFLVTHKDYAGLITPDLIYSNNSNPLAYKDDIVILQDEDGFVIDEVSYSEIPKNQSLERKSFYDNQCATASSSGEFLGNGCDRNYDNDDDNGTTDFEIRDVPNPQNSSNLPEPRQKPTAPQNFLIEYSSSTQELIFNWEESRDYSGATSTLIYKIFELNESDFFPIIETSSTASRIEIEEAGQDYNFSIQAADGEGLSSDFARSTISVPEFFQPTELTEPIEPAGIIQNNFISDVPANSTNCYDYLTIASSIKNPFGFNATQGPFTFQGLFRIQTIIAQGLRRFGDFPNDIDYLFSVSLLAGDNLETVAAVAGASISSNSLPATFQNVSFDLSTPYQVISTSTPYWLNFSYNHVGSNNYFYELCFSGTNEQPGSVFFRNPSALNIGLKNGFNLLGDIGWAISGWEN